MLLLHCFYLFFTLITPINSASFKWSQNEISSSKEAEFRDTKKFIQLFDDYYLAYSPSESNMSDCLQFIRSVTITKVPEPARLILSTTTSTTTSTTSVDSRKKEQNCTTDIDILDYPVPRFSDGEWISGKGPSMYYVSILLEFFLTHPPTQSIANV